MIMRRLLWGALLMLALFIQGCNKVGGDTAGVAVTGTAKQAAVSPESKASAGAAAQQEEDKPLPKGHPSMDAHAPLPTNPMEAMHILKMRVDQNPNDLEALITFGNANMMAQRYSTAVDLYSRALVINPKDLDVRTNLAIAYKSMENIDQAIVELKKNLAADPQHSASLFNLGFIYFFDKKDTRAASELWKKWLALNPDAEGAEEVKQHLAQIESPAAQQKPAVTDNKPAQKAP